LKAGQPVFSFSPFTYRELMQESTSTAENPTETVEEERQYSEEEKLMALRTLNVVKKYRTGMLTYEQFRKLPAGNLRWEYVRKWGRPRSAEEQRGKKREVSKRRAAQKMARKSKQRNRR
jgi:hypothetical protein